MIYFGVDPGTRNNMAIAMLVDTHWSVRLARPPESADIRHRAMHMQAVLLRTLAWFGRVDDPAVIAMEWQRPLPTDKNPRNICDLSAFAGIALATIQGWLGDSWCQCYLPLPEEWKGSIPKWARHNHIVAAVGIDTVTNALEQSSIPVPPDLGHFTKEFYGMAGNAIDAIGLALWAKKQRDCNRLVVR